MHRVVVALAVTATFAVAFYQFALAADMPPGRQHRAVTGRDLNCSAETDWLATAALRFGLTAGDALIYVKGGAAWGRDEYTFATQNTG